MTKSIPAKVARASSPRSGAEKAPRIDVSAPLNPYREDEDREQRPQLIQISDVKTRSVDFLWEPYMPLGKLGFLDGDPGVGKTWIALAVAAAATRGRPLPGSEEEREPRDAIYMSLEDSVNDTLRPRLEVLGADLDRIHFLEHYEEGQEKGVVTLGHVNVIGMAMAQVKPVLCVVDPFLAYLPKGHKHAEGARRILSCLKGLAERYDCTILGLRHLTKGGQIRGSVEIQAAARFALLVGRDGTERRVMAHQKSSLAPEGKSLVFDLQDGEFEWLGESPLRWPDLLKKQKEKPARREAGEFLQEALANGPRRATEVQSRAAAFEISRSTLNRAKDALRVRSFQQKRQWFWAEPEDDSEAKVVADLEAAPTREPDDKGEELSDEDGLFVLSAGEAPEGNA
jgi:RecA-family ATPase